MREVVLARPAERELERLPSEAQRRVRRKLEELGLDPYRGSAKMVGWGPNCFRVRVGDYRIVFDVSDDRVDVLRIRHRRDVYDR